MDSLNNSFDTRNISIHSFYTLALFCFLPTNFNTNKYLISNAQIYFTTILCLILAKLEIPSSWKQYYLLFSISFQPYVILILFLSVVLMRIAVSMFYTPRTLKWCRWFCGCRQLESYQEFDSLILCQMVKDNLGHPFVPGETIRQFYMHKS